MNENPMTISLKNAVRAVEHTAEAVMHEPPKPTKKKRGKRKLVRAVILLAVIALIGIGGYFAYGAFFVHSTAANANDVSSLVAKVSAHMMLPDEVPTLAVVSDLTKLKGQRFFEHAHEGDVVLMYPKAQEAILYSPALDRIIQVAPITNDTTPQAQQ